MAISQAKSLPVSWSRSRIGNTKIHIFGDQQHLSAREREEITKFISNLLVCQFFHDLIQLLSMLRVMWSYGNEATRVTDLIFKVKIREIIQQKHTIYLVS